jgi:hypothetical protein
MPRKPLRLLQLPHLQRLQALRLKLLQHPQTLRRNPLPLKEHHIKPKARGSESLGHPTMPTAVASLRIKPILTLLNWQAQASPWFAYTVSTATKSL